MFYTLDLILFYVCQQWRNRRVGAGGRGQSTPQRLLTRKFLLTNREKRGKEKKGKWSRKEGKLKKGGGKLKIEGGEVIKWEEDFFSFHFSKRLKFVLGVPKREFYTGKKDFTRGKKSGKMTLPPQKNIPLTHWMSVFDIIKLKCV